MGKSKFRYKDIDFVWETTTHDNKSFAHTLVGGPHKDVFYKLYSIHPIPPNEDWSQRYIDRFNDAFKKALMKKLKEGQ